MPLIRQTSPAGVVYYASPLLTQLGIAHAFSTRIGGVSLAPFDSLNLGNPNGCAMQDDLDHINENYRRLMHAIGCGHLPRHYIHQIHGDIVAVVGTGEFNNSSKGDALVTIQPNRLLSIRIADCCPILLATPDGRGVAAVHAGWRGAVSNILRNTVDRLTELSQFNPSDLIAAIGPCIGFDAFEVGPEVLDEFDRVLGPRSPIRRESSGKGHVNLPESCRLQLLSAGLNPDRIDTSDRCTFRDKDEFFSHRREQGITGRMSAMIASRSSNPSTTFEKKSKTGNCREAQIDRFRH
jgi:YfiH family protein